MDNDFLQPANGWNVLPSPRLHAPAPAARGLLFRTVSQVSGLFGREEIPDVFTVLHINPRLFWAWLLFASRLMPWGKLPAAVREKIILRTAWNCRSRYEWGQHVEIALRVGVSDDEIVAIAGGAEACVDEYEKAVMRACDEVFHDKCISTATWQTLSKRYSDRLLIEIMILIGHYEMLAGFLNSAGIALEADTEAELQAFYRRVAV